MQYNNSSSDRDAQTADNYDFFGSDDTEPMEVRKWKLGDHSVTLDFDAGELHEQADQVAGIDNEMASALREAANRVPTANVNDYECAVCGLTHGHSPDKHDIRAEFDVRPQFAESMQYNAACHCGVNELAMLVDFYEHITADVFTDEADLTQKNLKRRFDRIRSAADGADIADKTANAIEVIRADLEDRFDDGGPLTVDGGY